MADGRRGTCHALPMMMNVETLRVKHGAPRTTVRTVAAQPCTGEVMRSSTSHSPSTSCIARVTWSL